ncbi:glycosyltransferase family 15 protein [Lentinula lateritia]|uniref:Glycosyltransferase family 15 protein n=1 Tax=Lentinula aff. lateritia TaxID=2804960 RepID=A0ACC1TUZ7_9AGAR|nr:glycosyltransferase family 15 protein [Lentinula aff. lateritia]KAJ3848289.1 glycosyltransferase family 15 protein [Lentinula lateritia]
MNMTLRYLLAVFGVVITVHYVLSFTHTDYRRATSLNSLTSHFKGGTPADITPIPDRYYPPFSNETLTIDHRANATFVILARNSDIDGTVRSIREIEDRFNRRFRYPYVFLNEESFSDDFKKRVSVLSSARMEFGTIPRDHWYQPSSIDEKKADAGRNRMVEQGIIYGGSLSYRNMCRFNSGFFFRHPLMEKYRWYWRIEPDVHFHCDIRFDPFVFMEENNKVYAFTIAMYEFEKTIPSLWSHVKDFIKLHPEYLAKDNAMRFLSDTGGETYNLCHFWSNFEIADMSFWRGEAYTKFFEYLDDKGGFYYERWGDAPVHSIAAALFAPSSQIQFFDQIGYEHNPYTHCPRDEDTWKEEKCTCDPKRNFDYDGYSCMSKWDQV